MSTDNRKVNCEVIKLPTFDRLDRNKAPFFMDADNYPIYNPQRKDGFSVEWKDCTYYHLYITSYDPYSGDIKLGDWVYNPVSEEVLIVDEDDDLTYVQETYYKIIATTDSNLKQRRTVGDQISRSEIPLPRPSNKFIQKYCKLGGVVDVMVEYVKINLADTGNKSDQSILTNCNNWVNQLKVNSNNEIAISSVKNSWTREEVKHDLIWCVSEVAAQLGYTPTSDKMKEFNDATQEWIDNNL